MGRGWRPRCIGTLAALAGCRDREYAVLTFTRSRQPMETIRIPNEATYSPVALTDVAMAGPLITRLVLGTSLPGIALQTVALTLYAGSALQDWIERLGVRRIDFLREFGADVHHFEPMPVDVRRAEVSTLAGRLNDGYTGERPGLRELAPVVDRHLIDFIAGITDQRVETSIEIREFSLAGFMFPFALGAADILSGDVSIFRDTGVFQPHVVAHEFSHRKGYWRELEAQALSYLALTDSGEDVLVQAAWSERLYRSLIVLADRDTERWETEVHALGLRPELEEEFLKLRPDVGPAGDAIMDIMRALYDARMRITGQNGISDYDFGFTNFLYTFETSSEARQKPPRQGSVR